MLGTTGLHDLRVDCIVGIYPHERDQVQTVFLDIELDYDIGPAVASDAIPDAVDYDLVVATVTKLMQDRRFRLIETMAAECAALLLARMPRIEAIRLEVRKPAAVPAAASAFVRVERVRR